MRRIDSNFRDEGKDNKDKKNEDKNPLPSSRLEMNIR